MNNKKTIIILNWLISGTLFFCGMISFGSFVFAAYHPNDPKSPYILSFFFFSFLGASATFLWSVIISVGRKTMSTGETFKFSIFIYLSLCALAAILLLAIKPVPDYFIKSVGSQQYSVPSKFLMSGYDSGNSLRFWMCMEDLTGLYESGAKKCSAKEVTLMPESKKLLVGGYPHFFEQVNEFDLDGNSVVFNEGSERYRIFSENGLTLYTVDSLWEGSSLDPGRDYDRAHIPVHVQVNERNELIRFVHCVQYYSDNRTYCKHASLTPEGALYYALEGSTDFDLKYWQKKEDEILNLISEWKIK
ncbi:MAG: hypothetical protein AAGH78_09980 [Cyanobacteria bacterium P01_H01_bin.58]